MTLNLDILSGFRGLKEIDGIVQNPKKVYLSGWGITKITTKEGLDLSINKLAAKILSPSIFLAIEAKNGLTTILKVQKQLYYICNEALKGAPWYSKFLAWIRRLPNFSPINIILSRRSIRSYYDEQCSKLNFILGMLRSFNEFNIYEVTEILRQKVETPQTFLPRSFSVKNCDDEIRLQDIDAIANTLFQIQICKKNSEQGEQCLALARELRRLYSKSDPVTVPFRDIIISEEKLTKRFLTPEPLFEKPYPPSSWDNFCSSMGNFFRRIF